MLQSIGDKLKTHRWLGYIIMGLLAVVFAIWGAYGIVNMSFGSPDYGLKVNGEPISADILNRAWQERQAQYVQAANGADLTDAQRSQLQSQIIEEYERQALLRQRAHQSGFRASDADILAAYRSEPAFQVGGQFDSRAALTMLAQAGMTPESYEEDRREALETAQLTEGIEVSDFLTPSEAKRIYALENEQREVRYALLPPERYAAGIKIDEAKITAWYQAHASEYLTPESADLQYALLRLDAMAAQVSVTPQDLEAYYQKYQSRYRQTEMRHAHHILIAVGDSKDPKADAAALAKARQVLAELKAGKDFGALAKQYSADPASAAQGGDLGWAARSAYVPEFADALFSMKPGQISDPVKTQFGYHIIRLDEVRPESVRSLDEVRSQVESEYRREQAAALFGDRQEQLQQALDSGTATDLPQLAHRFELTLGEVKDFKRTSGGEPLGNKPDLLRAVFNEDALAGQKIIGPVAVADDQLVIFKVLAHHPPAPEPIAAVRDEIIAAIRKSQSTQAAVIAADQAVTKLEQGAPFDAVLKGLGVSAAPAALVGRSDPQVPPQIRALAFSLPAPTGGKPRYRAIGLDSGGAAIVALEDVRAGSAGANPKNDQQLEGEYLQRDRDGEIAAYLAELQRRARIERNPTLFQ